MPNPPCVLSQVLLGHRHASVFTWCVCSSRMAVWPADWKLAKPIQILCFVPWSLMDGAQGTHPEARAEVLPGEVYELRLALEKGMQQTVQNPASSFCCDSSVRFQKRVSQLPVLRNCFHGRHSAPTGADESHMAQPTLSSRKCWLGVLQHWVVRVLGVGPGALQHGSCRDRWWVFITPSTGDQVAFQWDCHPG